MKYNAKYNHYLFFSLLLIITFATVGAGIVRADWLKASKIINWCVSTSCPSSHNVVEWTAGKRCTNPQYRFYQPATNTYFWGDINDGSWWPDGWHFQLTRTWIFLNGAEGSASRYRADCVH